LTDIAAQKLGVKQPPVKQEAWAFSARASWIASGILLACMSAFFWKNEWPTANFLFSTSITVAIIAFITALTGRLLFATILATSQVIIVSLAATIKLKTMDMLVHAYDLFFYLNSLSTLTFLAKSFPHYIFGLFGLLLAMLFLGIVFFRLDSSNLSRWKSAVTVAIFTFIGFLSLEYIGERRHMHLYYENRFLSTYYGSWPETLRTLVRGQLIEAAPHSTGPAFTALGSCATGTKKPHVILIHQESLVPPSLFPDLVYDKSVDSTFKSFDGKLHKVVHLG
jgi:hypothetical protein